MEFLYHLRRKHSNLLRVGTSDILDDMNEGPKLILLNGFAGVGKTTLAKRYIADHPLSMSIEGDALIGMIGRWTEHETTAREYVRSFIKSITAIHLQNRKTVLLPYLLTDASHAQEFEELAKQYNAEYFEIYLSVQKNDAISRLLERGTWGEEGLPPVTNKDLPIIERDYTVMVQETKKRPNMLSIHPKKNDIEKTYTMLLNALGESK